MIIDNVHIDNDTEEILQKLLKKVNNNPPRCEDIWRIVDNIWDEIGCNNKKPNLEKFTEFYNHPVWLLNGLFTEQDEISLQHRHAISDWIVKKGLKKVLDYGGGFGTLAKLIASKDAMIAVDIYEPYPSKYAISKLANYSNLNFVNSLEKPLNYDCLICYTVLEHVVDPLKLFSEMVRLVKKDGYLIVANDFYPVIKCHLPSTFHLRYSFDRFAKLMGLELIELCDGSPAVIYRKKRSIPFNWRKIRIYEQISRVVFPFLWMVNVGSIVLKYILRKIIV